MEKLRRLGRALASSLRLPHGHGVPIWEMGGTLLALSSLAAIPLFRASSLYPAREPLWNGYYQGDVGSHTVCMALQCMKLGHSLMLVWSEVQTSLVILRH